MKCQSSFIVQFVGRRVRWFLLAYFPLCFRKRIKYSQCSMDQSRRARSINRYSPYLPRTITVITNPTSYDIANSIQAATMGPSGGQQQQNQQQQQAPRGRGSFRGRGRGSTFRSSAGSQQTQCFYCGYNGHMIGECRNLTTARQKWTTNQGQNPCHHCGNVGHQRHECRFYLAAKSRLGERDPIQLSEPQVEQQQHQVEQMDVDVQVIAQPEVQVIVQPPQQAAIAQPMIDIPQPIINNPPLVIAGQQSSNNNPPVPIAAQPPRVRTAVIPSKNTATSSQVAAGKAKQRPKKPKRSVIKSEQAAQGTQQDRPVGDQTANTSPSTSATVASSSSSNPVAQVPPSPTTAMVGSLSGMNIAYADVVEARGSLDARIERIREKEES